MSIYLRTANEKDIQLLFEWANDSSVRSNSFNSNPIAFEEHKQWFNKTINNPNIFLYILCSDEENIGQIRLDKNDDGSAIVNYSISKPYRGMGYGQIIIQLINNKIISDSLPISSLIAKVKKDNVASQLIFEKCDYKLAISGDFLEYRTNIHNLLIISDVKTGGVILSNNKNSFTLLSALEKKFKGIILYSDPIDIQFCQSRKPSFIISYNYSHIISPEVIHFYGDNKIINIHISMLPFNKGSDPNFWSFIDNTPKGVSIHYISKGLDSGAILMQQELFFDETKETFSSTYAKLNNVAVELFTNNADKILKGTIQAKEQTEQGTYHKRADFMNYIKEKDFSWNMIIADFKSNNQN